MKKWYNGKEMNSRRWKTSKHSLLKMVSFPKVLIIFLIV
jgi:hypothetical protein